MPRIFIPETKQIVTVMGRTKKVWPDGYEQESLLSDGVVAKVYLAKNKQTQAKVAIKIYEKEKMSIKDYERLSNEHYIMELLLSCPFVVHLHEYIAQRDSISLVMEYCAGGDVFQLVQQKVRLAETEARNLITQLVDAMEIAHSNGIAHRDIKLENLFLSTSPGTPTLRVGDWGLACTWRHGLWLTEQCGTIHYTAPEVFAGRYEGPEIDIWSMGVCLYTMVVGHFPFTASNDAELIRKIKSGRYEQLPFTVSDSLKDLLKRMLQVNKQKRFTLREIKNHPWVLGESMKSKPRSFLRTSLLSTPQYLASPPDSEEESSPAPEPHRTTPTVQTISPSVIGRRKRSNEHVVAPVPRSPKSAIDKKKPSSKIVATNKNSAVRRLKRRRKSL
eukprot:TRINITY_DN3574_c0_g1_i1.p1 TRINITY_DN3574_c0_g1~~TRINITY_DN3574_c0_g1_i1.p1  ORF type:complete len:388 (-),score=52.59 TRINITY_DN3574_c0_g1_i1:65-1228(-)